MSSSLDRFGSDLDGSNAWMFSSDQPTKGASVETLADAGLHGMGSCTFFDMASH